MRLDVLAPSLQGSGQVTEVVPMICIRGSVTRRRRLSADGNALWFSRLSLREV
jgi:hypothetical protein